MKKSIKQDAVISGILIHWQDPAAPEIHVEEDVRYYLHLRFVWISPKYIPKCANCLQKLSVETTEF